MGLDVVVETDREPEEAMVSVKDGITLKRRAPKREDIERPLDRRLTSIDLSLVTRADSISETFHENGISPQYAPGAPSRDASVLDPDQGNLLGQDRDYEWMCQDSLWLLPRLNDPMPPSSGKVDLSLIKQSAPIDLYDPTLDSHKRPLPRRPMPHRNWWDDEPVGGDTDLGLGVRDDLKPEDAGSVFPPYAVASASTLQAGDKVRINSEYACSGWGGEEAATLDWKGAERVAYIKAMRGRTGQVEAPGVYTSMYGSAVVVKFDTPWKGIDEEVFPVDQVQLVAVASIAKRGSSSWTVYDVRGYPSGMVELGDVTLPTNFNMSLVYDLLESGGYINEGDRDQLRGSWKDISTLVFCDIDDAEVFELRPKKVEVVFPKPLPPTQE